MSFFNSFFFAVLPNDQFSLEITESESNSSNCNKIFNLYLAEELSSGSSEEDLTDEEDCTMEELTRKQQHPDRLHREMWLVCNRFLTECGVFFIS